MNEVVPDFQADDDYQIQSSTGLPRSSKSQVGDEEIMELLWQNGQVVVQSQNQKSTFKKSEQHQLCREIQVQEEEQPQQQNQLFMQEDEMATWLHYPMEDESSFGRDLYSDLFYPNTVSCAPPPPVPRIPEGQETGSFRPPEEPPSVGRLELPECSGRFQNFAHFSRAKPGRESTTVVDSNITPAREPHDSRISSQAEGASTAQVSGGDTTVRRGGDVAGTTTFGGTVGTMCELTVTSSPGGSGASISASAEPLRPMAAATEDRKRKGVEIDDADCQSEDLEFESPDVKKREVRGSTSAKRSRAAEVHNLSERRRRDRINEKMKALQELIPRCNKSDKASMLDEAIEYLKSLQLQVQMMSMGCGMVPVMFPGVHQYIQPMGMGMGMGMEMAMNRPMMPFLPVVPGSALPNPAASTQLGPRFPMPTFHMPSVPIPNPSGTQVTNHSDPVLNSRNRNFNQPQMPFFPDPYQQYLGLQQTQLSLPENQVMTQPSTSKPSSSREVGNLAEPKSG